MGLYPRYEALRKRGGDYFMAFDEEGMLGAVGSVAPQDDGYFRGDFFSLPSFDSVVPEIIKKIEEFSSKVYFEIAKSDKNKERILKENGYKIIGEGILKTGDLMIQTIKYAR
jgi:hypothetical protein